MSSVETTDTTTAAVETGGAASTMDQKRFWSENQSDVGLCEERGGSSTLSSTTEEDGESSKAASKKYHSDARRGNGGGIVVDHTAALEEGSQVTTTNREECSRREEINGKRPSSSPSADGGTIRLAPSSADAGIPTEEAAAVGIFDHISAQLEGSDVVVLAAKQDPSIIDHQQGEDILRQHQSVVEQPSSDIRRAYWSQPNNLEKMATATAASSEIEQRPASNFDSSSRIEQEQSRSSTPSSSSSDVYRRSYQQQQRPPFLAAPPAAAAAAAVAAAAAAAAHHAASVRHHAPFPFFANPFMVPFAPHLPQQAANVQSPSLQDSPASNEKMTPEEWNSNMAGVRRNPDSGGFYLHPQYYHELLQQYFRNMAVGGEMLTTTGVMDETNQATNSTSNGDSKNAPTIDPLSLETQAATIPTQEQRPESASDDSKNRPESLPGTVYANRDAIGSRLAGQTDTPLSEWHGETAPDVEATEINSIENAVSTSNEASIETSTEGSPTKVSRPETLELADDLAKEQVSEPEVSDRNGARTEPDVNNPAMVLIKKQISEIEKQILRKAQNQNIRKMDAKEIEAFLLMEQQRTLEANLFESTTNTGAWPSPHPSALSSWLQNDAINWDRAGAMAEAIARQQQQQFEATPDQRSLYELAAAAGVVGGESNPLNQQQAPPPSGFVQAHFPQAGSAFVPAPHQAMYPSAVPWPPAPFYPPHGAAANFGFPAAQGYFPPPGGVYGGTVPHQFMAAAAAGYPTAAMPPIGVMPPFTTNGPPPPQLQQQRPHFEQDPAMVRFNNAVHAAQHSEANALKLEGSTISQSGFGSDSDHGGVHGPPPVDGGPWRESGDEQYLSDQGGPDDEPVWVLRESYVRKVKREEERLAAAEKERSAKQQAPNDVVEKAPTTESDAFNETDKLLDASSTRNESRIHNHQMREEDEAALEEAQAQKKAKKKKEVMVHEPAVLIEGVLFRARYLGSTQLVCDGRPTKATRMMQAQEAVSRIKAPDGEPQPSTDVDLFISTEKIMVLNTDLQDIMMDHPLRTISYIADIGDLVVLMARRVSQSTPDSPEPAISRTPRVICHVFESEEAQFIAQSIGQAFQVAYMEFLRANGIDDPGYLRDVDYQEVLNAQEIFGEELEMFARKETQKDVVVPKQKNENFGVVIVESGWGSMLPTVVIANLMPGGPAARSNNLNIGDHIIALNGISFVGLPLSACQNHIRNVKHLTAVKLTVVHTPPVVEVRIKRPDTKYQLGFSVQNGVICSLLRGGIAERGGVRVGHRIIEINSQSVVAVPHEKIVTMLATAVGEIQMKTMPTSMFRLLTGQETPNYI